MSKSEQFEEHYQNWVTSGTSKAGYCKQAGVAYHWFLYHFKRRQLKETGFASIKIGRFGDSSGMGIEPCRNIEYHFADGSFFVFPVNCPLQIIRSLIG